MRKLFRISIMNLNIFQLIKHLTVVSVVVLIIGCIFYLVTAVQVMQQIIQQLERAERLEGNSPGVPLLLNQAKALYDRTEPALTLQIIICSTTTALSMVGLMAIVREYLPLILIYAVVNKILFVANFFLISRLKPWIIVMMAFASLMSFSFSYMIRKQKTSASVEVSLPDVYFTKNKD